VQPDFITFTKKETKPHLAKTLLLLYSILEFDQSLMCGGRNHVRPVAMSLYLLPCLCRIQHSLGWQSKWYTIHLRLAASTGSTQSSQAIRFEDILSLNAMIRFKQPLHPLLMHRKRDASRCCSPCWLEAANKIGSCAAMLERSMGQAKVMAAWCKR